MLKPLEKLRVATNKATAKAVPDNAERTGTAVRPRPGSSAKRIPSTPVTGIPAASAPRTTLELRVAPCLIRDGRYRAPR